MDRDTGARLCALYDYEHAAAADPSDRSFDALLAAYTTLRHLEAIEAGEEAAAGTPGIGVLHHPLQGRRYSFILIEDNSLALPSELRAASLESRFGVFDGHRIVEAASLEPVQSRRFPSTLQRCSPMCYAYGGWLDGPYPLSKWCPHDS
jgi:hypothetical protein